MLPPDAHADSLLQAQRELARLQRQIEHAQLSLAGLRRQVAELPGSTGPPTLQLVQANEQLVVAALRAQSDAVSVVLALDEASQSAEREALTELRSREAMARLNASLEQRVTERTHELELARDEALAAARAKEQFLSNMSHEIRTPMNGMLGAMELLSHTALTPQQAQYIHVAATSGEALLGIINDVLDFAKIGAGQLQLDQEPIDLNAIARSVTTLFSAAAQRKPIALRFVPDPALTGWRLGDALRLRQVLMNLVGNAVKFTARGSVTVSVRALGAATGDAVAFEVSDTGLGIDPAQHTRIFEPFVQADGPSSRRQGGTGLGLAISRQLVRAMGGELRVRSAVGEGASFCFELSLAPATDATGVIADVLAAVPSERPHAALLSGRALLVEDNSVNQLVGAAMLQALGFEVVLAEHGEEALARLAEGAVAVVLMDCQMPVMDGFEATQRLREIERLSGRARTPVIAVTANAFGDDVERCAAAGMDAHLAKPFTMAQLRAVIEPWVPAA